MSKLKYKTAYNAKPSKGQKFVKPSNTIQGQAISVSQMIQRMRAGVPILGTVMDYPDDETEENIIIRDLTDIDDILQKVSETQFMLDEHQKAYAKAKAEKELVLKDDKKVILD